MRVIEFDVSIPILLSILGEYTEAFRLNLKAWEELACSLAARKITESQAKEVVGDGMVVECRGSIVTFTGIPNAARFMPGANGGIKAIMLLTPLSACSLTRILIGMEVDFSCLASGLVLQEDFQKSQSSQLLFIDLSIPAGGGVVAWNKNDSVKIFGEDESLSLQIRIPNDEGDNFKLYLKNLCRSF